jgi:hypothetical protein
MNTKLLLPLLVVAGAIYMMTRSNVSYRLQQAKTRDLPDIYTKVIDGQDTQQLFVKNAAGQFIPFA